MAHIRISAFRIVSISLVFVTLCGCATMRRQPSWKFVVAGDSRGGDNGVNSQVVNRLIPAIIGEGPDLVLCPGDLVTRPNGSGEGASLIYWRKLFMEPLQHAGIDVYPVPGNHDLAGGGKHSLSAWRAAFTNDYALPQNGPEDDKDGTYAVLHNRVLFLNMNGYQKANEFDLEWMAEQLEAGGYDLVFTQGHQPMTPLKGGHRDTLQSSKQKRDELIELLATHGGQTYFCGHDHWYDHALIRQGKHEMHQFIVGTAGAPLRDWGKGYLESNVEPVAHAKCFGYVVVEVSGRSYTITMKRLNDDNSVEVIDQLSR